MAIPFLKTVFYDTTIARGPSPALARRIAQSPKKEARQKALDKPCGARVSWGAYETQGLLWHRAMALARELAGTCCVLRTLTEELKFRRPQE